MLPDSFRLRLWSQASALALLTLTAGCAHLPPDGGRDGVATLTQARGLALPAVGDDSAAIDTLLAQPLSLRNAISLALLRNPRFRAAMAQLGFAGAEVLAANRLANPVLSGALGFPNVADAATRFSFGIAADFVGLLTMPARRRYAEAEFALVQQRVAAAVLDLAADTGRAYYRATAAERAAELAAANAELADATLQLASALAEAGNLTPLELSQRRIAAGETRQQQLIADAEAASAHEALGLAMGLPTQRAYALAALPELPTQDPDTAALAQRAVEQRLDLAAARAHVSALQTRLRITRATRWLDDASLGAQHERDSDGRRTSGPTLQLAVPLDGGSSRVLSGESELAEAQAEADTLQLAIGHEVTTALAQLAAARGRVQLLGTQLLPAHEAAVAQMQAQYNYMLASPFDLLQQRRQQYGAQQQYLDALRDYWLARVDLARAVGGSATDAAADEPGDAR